MPLAVGGGAGVNVAGGGNVTDDGDAFLDHGDEPISNPSSRAQ